MRKYVKNSIQNYNKIDDVITGTLYFTSFFVLGVKVQLLTNFSISRGIKLKFGPWVNFEMLILYFMSILPHKMNLMKIKGVLCHFFTNFIRPLFKKCCHGNIEDDTSIKVAVNNDP